MGEKIYTNNWISIYKGFYKTNFRVGPASYEDDRMHFNFCPTFIISLIGMVFTGLTFWSLFLIPFLFVGYGQIYMDLPFHSGIDDSEPPEYGFYLYSPSDKLVFTSFWLCLGKRKKCFYMPWDWDWVRTSALKKDGTWEHETKKDRKSFYDDEWKKILWIESYPYTYVLKKGKIQNRLAEIKVEEREWRWKGLKWLPFIRTINKTIDVKFKYNGPLKRYVILEKNGFKNPYFEDEVDEIGERTGSYKGGTTGCSYRMLKNETPLETLRRMEKERIFN